MGAAPHTLPKGTSPLSPAGSAAPARTPARYLRRSIIHGASACSYCSTDKWIQTIRAKLSLRLNGHEASVPLIPYTTHLFCGFSGCNAWAGGVGWRPTLQAPQCGTKAPRSQHRPAGAETNHDKNSPLERAPFSARCLSTCLPLTTARLSIWLKWSSRIANARSC